MLYKTDNGCEFWATKAQSETIDNLKTINRGGIGTVYGYVSKSGRTKPEKANIQFLTAFSTEKLYERKIETLNGISFGDIVEIANKDEKLSELPSGKLQEIFEARKDMEIASARKTLDGDRSDSRRASHDRNYCHVGKGVKVHYVTEKKDGIMVPVLRNGHPIANSIMLTILEINRTVVDAGEYKIVNSGAPVRISNAIKKITNKRSIGLKTLSLKEDNFERLVVSKQEFLPEDVKGIPADLFVK